ncbi:hypothetical protein [Leptospira bourretii]|uniref:Uncharacterized protein n=1 Tax=Leptospira bourretii TaxID=2484962 RepID=A0ABY2LJM5_9LEPT|nr:hypothetical protein [Leptospira bourretii]TGK92236.1 hypothetical protein EHQ26_09675 [Leptospira bourretii]TGL33442.1 hypothetical protein EHQ45_10080 [Leptospira bourretii]
MKTKNLILLIILTITVSISAEESKKINSNQINERLQNIENKLEDLQNKNLKENLENRLQYSIEIIQSQDARFSSISSLFGIISIVLGIYTLAIPFLTYVIAIRPARTVIGKLKNDLNFFIQDYENSQVEKSIENLQSDDVQIMKNSELYLSLNQHYKFTEKQLFSLFDLLDKGIEDSAKNIVKIIILGNKCKYADRIYQSLVNSEYNATNDYYISRYLAINGIKNHKGEISSYLNRSKIKQNAYVSLANYIILFSSKELINFLNEEEIINIFNKSEHESLIKSLDSIFKSKPVYSVFNKTKLYNLFNGV